MRNIILGCVALNLSACAVVGPDYKLPEQPIDVTNNYYDQTLTEGLYRNVDLDVDWWKTLNDNALDQLIETALLNNHDLRIAMANLSSARAVLAESETEFMPSIDTEGSVEGKRMAGYQQGSNDVASDDNIVTSLGLGMAWELDLFGQVTRSVEAATANIEVQQALLADIQRIVITDVVSAYIDYRGAQQQMRVIEKNIANQHSTLQITKLMAREGMSTGLDISRAQAQLTLTQALLPTVKADIVAARNRIATLTSQSAAEVDQQLLGDQALPVLPSFIAVSEPEKLIRQRPDIKAAERQLASLTAIVGVSMAQLFPSVSFNGNVGFGADTPSEIGAVGAFNYGIGPSIRWNLFNREAIRARIKQAEANVEAQLAEYDKTVLMAFEEINTTMVQHGYERQRNDALAASVGASLESVELVRARYNAGAESFLAVLDAERTLLDSEQQLTSSDIALNQSLIMIYKALGGGWH